MAANTLDQQLDDVTCREAASERFYLEDAFDEDLACATAQQMSGQLVVHIAPEHRQHTGWRLLAFALAGVLLTLAVTFLARWKESHTHIVGAIKPRVAHSRPVRRARPARHRKPALSTHRVPRGHTPHALVVIKVTSVGPPPDARPALPTGTSNAASVGAPATPPPHLHGEEFGFER